jgi:hypothetical protein
VKSRRYLQFGISCAIVLSLAGALLGQDPRLRVLVVNGKTVGAILVVIDGHSYVDVETLAKFTNAAITIEPTRIALTIPGPGGETGPATATAGVPPQSSQELSKNFAVAAIAEVAEMREWRGAIGTMITYGLAVSGQWAAGYQDQVQVGLGQAASAATTEGDRDTLQLLRNETAQLTSWAAGVSADRKNLNGAQGLDPNALHNDPAMAKITACSHFLNAMLVTGSFSDDASCH